MRSQRRSPKNYIPNLFLPVVPTTISWVSSNMHPMPFLVLLFPAALIHSSSIKWRRFWYMVQSPHIWADCLIFLWNRHRLKLVLVLWFWKPALRTMVTCSHSAGWKFCGSICGNIRFLCNALNRFCQNCNMKGIFLIMEWLVQVGSLSYNDKICFNHCHLAYRAMTITDVIMGDGTKVTKHALDLSCLSQALSKWDWPNECPCNKDILHWHNSLKCLTSENLSFPFSLQLEHWIQPLHLNW